MDLKVLHFFNSKPIKLVKDSSDDDDFNDEYEAEG